MKFRSLLSKIVIVVLSISLLSGCKASRTVKGGAIGAAAGGLVGGLIGSGSHHTAEGAIIGAVVGGTAGALIGNYMDKQAKEIQRDLKGARVERVGEGIKITFDSGILFDVNSYALKSASKTNLTNLSKVLNKYADTNILIEGHTDNTGGVDYNQTLSENRAGSVSNYLKMQNVLGNRISTVGYGETQPVGDNSTSAGKAQNRRVEVAIYANDKLKRAAKRGDIK
jgi:outer membrane protein OmpA-like peptidoglycan-associated protein